MANGSPGPPSELPRILSRDALEALEDLAATVTRRRLAQQVKAKYQRPQDTRALETAIMHEVLAAEVFVMRFAQDVEAAAVRSSLPPIATPRTVELEELWDR